MRKSILALVAISLAVPASMAVPIEGAQALKHHRYKEWRCNDFRAYFRWSSG